MSSQSSALFDKNTLKKELHVDDKSLICKLLEEFNRQLQEVDKLASCVDTEDEIRSFIAQHTHRLKASSQAIGARQLAKCLLKLDEDSSSNPGEMRAVFRVFQLLIIPTQKAIAAEIANMKG